MRVAIVPTGIANLASVQGALARLDAGSFLAGSATDVQDGKAVVLPGVGDFGAGMRALRDGGFDEPLRRRIQAGRPLLAVCLGMQLCFEESDEAPGVGGLGALPGHAGRFPETVRTPQMGWNEITPADGAGLLQPGFAYFANSYRVQHCPTGWIGAVAEHGGPFLAACERGAVLLCQFHPELSSAFGRELLGRWLARAAEATC